MKNIKTAMQLYKESQERKQKKEEEGLSDYKKQLLHNRRSRLNDMGKTEYFATLNWMLLMNLLTHEEYERLKLKALPLLKG